MSFHHDHPNFECPIEISDFAADLTAGLRATIYEDGQSGPQKIIDITNNWVIDVEWFVHGHLARHLCGTFCVGVHLESVGEGEEYSFETQEMEMDPCGDGHYRLPFRIPAGKVKAGDCGKVYIVAVTLTSKDPCGRAGHIAGFCRKGSLMFTNAADS